jgi:hypothetical protein
MNAVITETLRVDTNHAVHIIDSRLIPGEEVEVIVRPVSKRSFLQTAQAIELNTPTDYSTSYEDKLRSS